MQPVFLKIPQDRNSEIAIQMKLKRLFKMLNRPLSLHRSKQSEEIMTV
jgi:hypothetical protein